MPGDYRALDPGQLDEQITIRKPVETRDAYGAPLKTWTDVLTVWAQFEELGGSEVTRSAHLMAVMTARVIIRHTSTRLDTSMRIYRPQNGSLWGIDAIAARPGRQSGYELRATNVDRVGATVAA